MAFVEQVIIQKVKLYRCAKVIDLLLFSTLIHSETKTLYIVEIDEWSWTEG